MRGRWSLSAGAVAPDIRRETVFITLSKWTIPDLGGLELLLLQVRMRHHPFFDRRLFGQQEQGVMGGVETGECHKPKFVSPSAQLAEAC
jgi:hypothetical protein